jgi:3-methyl-2-oxobutanoate hydroxymethyltransferase
MSTAKKEIKKVTTHQLQEMKSRGEKISMLTAYDYSYAKIVDDAGVDVILVGDSASNVMAGHDSTLPITLDQMIYHAQSVIRAVDRALVVVDMPFGSYQGNSSEALRSAIRIMKESGAHAVKLTPQSIYKFGTYTVRAKEDEEANELKEDALLLQEAGCFGIVLEKIPAKLATEVAKNVSIPVIGIGAGSGVDGQVLVLHDLLGVTKEFSPRFLRRYLNLYEEMKGAVGQYIKDVKSKDFPNEKEQY